MPFFVSQNEWINTEVVQVNSVLLYICVKLKCAWVLDKQLSTISLNLREYTDTLHAKEWYFNYVKRREIVQHYVKLPQQSGELKDGTFAGRFFLPVWIFVVSQTVFKDLLILYREQSEIEALLWRTWCNAHYSHKYLIFSPFLSVEWRQKNALNRETWPARHAFHRSLMNWMINTQLFCIFKGSLNIAFTYPKLNSHIPILYERVLFCYF